MLLANEPSQVCIELQNSYDSEFTVTIPLKCKNCSHSFQSTGFSGSFTLEISGSAEACPRCGSMAAIPDGTYVIVKNLIKAFYAEGEDFDQVKILENIIKLSLTDGIDKQEIANSLKDLSSSFLSIWKQIGNNANQIALILSAISLLYNIYTNLNPGVDVAKSQAIASRQLEVEHQILEELKKNHASSAKQYDLYNQETLSRQPYRQKMQKAVKRNRHERRKDAALKRKYDGR